MFSNSFFVFCMRSLPFAHQHYTKRLPPLYLVGKRHGFILHIGGNYRVWMKCAEMVKYFSFYSGFDPVYRTKSTTDVLCTSYTNLPLFERVRWMSHMEVTYNGISCHMSMSHSDVVCHIILSHSEVVCHIQKS
jgi:hypothetical protein